MSPGRYFQNQLLGGDVFLLKFMHEQKGSAAVKQPPKGKYIACGFWYGLEFVKKPNMEKKLFCFEGAKNTKIKPGEFCMDVMSSEKLVFQSGGSRWYSLGY